MARPAPSSVEGERDYRYNAFIAYKRGIDDDLAAAVQRGMHRLAKPLFSLRATRVFRDKTSMGSTVDWQSYIDEALKDSAHLVVLMSPESMASEHVKHEVAHFVERGDADAIHLAVTATPADVSFDDLWSGSSLPHHIKRISERAPHLVDFTTARRSPEFNLRNPTFRNAVLDIASGVREIDKDVLDGEDIRRQKRLRSLAIAIVAVLGVLTIVAVVGWRNATIARTQAEARSLAAQSIALAEEQPDLAALLAIEGHRTAESIETLSALYSIVYGRGEVIRYLRGHDAAVFVAYEPSGRSIVTADTDGVARIHDSLTGETITDLKGNDAGFASVAYTPDSGYVVGGMRDGSVRWWDAVTGEMVGQSAFNHNETVQALAFADDSAIVASGARDGTLVIWGLPSGEAESFSLEAGEAVMAIALEPGSELLYSVSARGTVTTWELGPLLRARTTFETRSHAELSDQEPVVGATVSVASGLVAIGGYDNTVSLWDLVTGTQVGGLLSGHASFVTSVQFDATGSVLVSGGGDRAINVWDPLSGTRLLGPYVGHEDQLTSISVLPGGKGAVTGALTGEAVQWSFDSPTSAATPIEVGTESELLRGGDTFASYSALGFDSPSGLIAVGTGNGLLYLIDSESGARIVPPVTLGVEVIWDVALSRGGKVVVTGLADGSLRIIDGETGAEIQNWIGDAEILEVAIDAVGNRVVAGREDGVVAYWDLDDAEPTGFTRQSAPVTGLAISHDGKIVVSESLLGQRLTISDLEEGVGFSIDTASGNAVAIDPSGGTVVYQDLSNALVFVDTDEGSNLGAPIRGLDASATDLDFSDDGRYLAATTTAGEVHVFSVESRRRMGDPLSLGAEIGVAGRIGGLPAALFTNDGTSVRRWPLNASELMAKACHMASRDLTPNEWSQFIGDVAGLRSSCSDAG